MFRLPHRRVVEFITALGTEVEGVARRVSQLRLNMSGKCRKRTTRHPLRYHERPVESVGIRMTQLHQSPGPSPRRLVEPPLDGCHRHIERNRLPAGEPQVEVTPSSADHQFVEWSQFPNQVGNLTSPLIDPVANPTEWVSTDVAGSL